ncbi:hypothetical protein JTE90_005301 [Oedothorax gibbosus]|uniref:Uncharacterized protein n=1 Tax=Oedothorax gibbosus TaxID=931172 RepID=A0AAV6UVZ1_9ARAC|nr:hypothetical protein JTE90_005301 [Oedothorax gibbosus]
MSKHHPVILFPILSLSEDRIEVHQSRRFQCKVNVSPPLQEDRRPGPLVGPPFYPTRQEEKRSGIASSNKICAIFS